MTAVPVPPLTDAELAEIEARVAAATDVPWVAEAYDVDGVRGYRIFDPSGDVCIAGNFDYEVGGIIERADAEFIAAARTDVPRLAASLRAARAELAQLRTEVGSLRSGYAREKAYAQRLRAERDQVQAELAAARPDRDAAKALIHPTLHGLDVRITNIPGDCHCNLIAEVILDALYGRSPQTEEGADRV